MKKMEKMVNMTVPLGAIFAFPSESLPVGFLPCDGREILVSSYPDLFKLVGSTFGSPSVGHFRLPDLRRRVVVGAGGTSSIQLGAKVGSIGGWEQVTLTEAQLPSHQHISPLGESPQVLPNGESEPFGAVPGSGNKKFGIGAWDRNNQWLYTSAVGGNQPHDNMQPSMVFIYAVKV